MSRIFETSNELRSFLENGEFIYVIYTQYGCKIGYTKSPLERLEQIRLGLPSQKCLFIGLYIGDKARTYESKLHGIFKNKSLSREWFCLTDEDNDKIEQLLIRNSFTCLIKQSILWSNYLEPSIFLKGNVKVVKMKEGTNEKSKINFEIPFHLSELIANPDNYDDQSNKTVKFKTATEISIYLQTRGFKYSPVQVGMIMKSLNIKRGAKHFPVIGARYGYFVIINED